MPRVAVALVMLAFTVSANVGGALAREPASRVDIRADIVGFYPYSDGSLVTAAGRARLRVGRRTIDADAIRYEIDAARIVAAGNVVVSGRGDELRGAAYRLDLDTDKAYLIRLDPLPTTLALVGDDAASASEGPAPPGAFDVPDLDGQRPYIRSRHASVVAGSGIRMSPAEFPTSAGIAPSLPTYLYTLVTNQNIAQTAGPGASFDQPYNLFGSPASLTAGHVRYESQNGVTASLDTRLVDRDRAYAVASVEPLRNRRFDLVAFQQLRRGVQQTFDAAHTFARVNPFTTLQYRIAATGKLTTTSLTATQFDASNDVEIGLATVSRDLGNLFNYQLSSAYGYGHTLGGFPFANDFHTSLGGNFASRSLALGAATLSARYTYFVTAYDYAHQSSFGNLTFQGSRRIPHVVDLLATVAFAQNANRYRDVATGRRALGLPNPTFPYYSPDNTLFPGYFAYAGLNTYRTYALSATFSGHSNEDRIALTLTHTRDFPQSFGYGRPPLTAGIDIIRRLTPTIKLELGRSYTFGYGAHYLSPQYSFGISP